jgi:iron complex transport system ATP-binding protein
MDTAAAHAALARLGIAHLADRPYTLISGGERQLALIARALAQESRIVVLDEPTASLDFGNQGKVMREIRSLAAAGLTVAFSTHDPNHALRYADRAMLIRDGRCLASGEAREVLTREHLEALYGTAVTEVRSAAAHAFLPG